MRPLGARSLGAWIATALFTVLPARAQGVDALGPYGGLEHARYPGSPQYFALELRFGPYRPRVDRDLAGTPLEDLYGDKRRFLVGAEFDWQALRIPHLGSLGPGVGIGTVSFRAKAPFTDGSGLSGEETRFRALPMHLVGVLRVDVLAQELKIPLAFAGKAGLGYGLWWARGDDHLERSEGVVAAGSSYGYHLAAQAQILLDAIDPGAALNMDSSTGVNNAYLFAEVLMSDLDGFGSGRMDVGGRTWMGGVALEF